MTKKQKKLKKAFNRVNREFRGLTSLILDVAKTGQIPADYKQRLGVHMESQIAQVGQLVHLLLFPKASRPSRGIGGAEK